MDAGEDTTMLLDTKLGGGTRMSPDRINGESLAAQVASEDKFDEQGKCGLLQAFARFDLVERETIERLLSSDCQPETPQ